MDIEEIKFHINEYIENALICAQQSCTNSFSKNIKLIINFISIEENEQNLNFNKSKKIKCLKKRKFISVNNLALEIFKNQYNLSWIDFVLFYTSKNETIIIVDLIESENNKELNFHCSIMAPRPTGYVIN